MEQESQSNLLRIGSRLFYICWLVSLVAIICILIWGIGSIQSPSGFFLFLVLLCMAMFPFLKSFTVGNIFSMQVRELANSVEKLKDSVQNILIQQSQNTQNVNLTLLNDLEGREFKIKTGFKSQRYSDLGYSLFLQERYMESLGYYEKAFESDPNNWVAAKALGFIYLSLTDYEKDQSKWGFRDKERLLRSVFYSMYATKNDPNHYEQFMNLGIALRHLEGKNLVKLGMENLQKAFDMLINVPQVLNNPKLMTARGKCRSFMGEFAKLLGESDIAIQYRKEAVDIFNSCPEPVPKELNYLLKDAETAISELEKEEGS